MSFVNYFVSATQLRVTTLISNFMGLVLITLTLNPLTPELNPSAQRYLTRVFTGDFDSSTVHFVNICVKHQQIHQFIPFINYIWYILHVSALHCHRQGAFLVPSEDAQLRSSR
jgi:hypothetical protein